MPNQDHNYDVSVCLPIGGYKSEIFAHQRLQWLVQTVEDLNSQTLQPSEVIVSINSNIEAGLLPEVRDILSDIKAPLNVLSGGYTSLAAENFERAIQHSSCPYFSIWSDHDLHAKSFLETLMGLHRADNSLALACSLFSQIDENGQLVKKRSTICDAVEAVGPRAVERLKVMIRANLLGAVYGLISRVHYQACSRSINSLGPDILLSYELGKHGGFKVTDDILWSERTRSASTIPSRVRHAEFYNPTDLIAGHDIPVTHHLLTSFKLFQDPSYLSTSEQRMLRAISMRVCERKFVSFACARELRSSFSLGLNSIARRDPWLFFSSMSIIAFQIYWLLYLLFVGALYNEMRVAFARKRQKRALLLH